MGSGGRGQHQPAQGGAVPDPTILEFRYRPAGSGVDPTSGEADQVDARRAELARQLNASIYKVGQSLTDQADDEVELTFFCACGCMAEVKRSLRDYVTRGAVVAGHARRTPFHT